MDLEMVKGTLIEERRHLLISSETQLKRMTHDK
jgi:hypothetical protein